MKLIGEHWEGDVRVRWYDDGDQLRVERWQDAEPAIEHVAELNSIGVETADGLGRPLAEIPLAEAMRFCGDRGIPWEKFLYTNEYDAEFKRFLVDRQRLVYRPVKKFH